MPISVERQSSFSSRSITGSSAVSVSGAMQLAGQFGQSSLFGSSSGQASLFGSSSGQTSLFGSSSFQTRSPSVYGGAGGYGTRISQSVFTSGSMGSYQETSVIGNEKMKMQNLNDRLASYLTKVRTLEAANRKLELQIREYYEKRAPSVSADYTSFFATITDLRAKIQRSFLENERIRLQMDNNQLTVDDFKMKYEMEMNLRLNVDADVARYRGVRDSLTLGISDLEMQIEGLKEELAYMKSNHEEEMRLLRVQQSGKVNVEVDSTESVDLSKILEEMRLQYESVVQNNNIQLEKWFKSQLDILITTRTKETTEVKTFLKELSELKRTYQSIEINRNSVLTEIQCLKRNVEETKARYSFELSQLQLTINTMETQLQQLFASMEQQKSEYSILLDIKMRLELEIAEYRRLLEGDHYESPDALCLFSAEHKPHIERRVKTIVEEIIDGKVVSSSVDTQVEDIQ
ncbi:Keratin [Nibea albiflora]|uniref:Keratin n=1 Tax=Nibea albiflora TaxID=240163 RepID=A0ACB7FMA3_NIBAL|nr:Keratin [Nibea albiflora]